MTASAPISSTAASASAGRATTQEVSRRQVDLALPAEASYLALLRTTGAALGARMDFTLDEIEDLRIAVDEAGALLLTHADPDRQLSCSFVLGDDIMGVTVRVAAAPDAEPDTTSFAWTVLQALAGPVQWSNSDGELCLSLQKAREERA